MMFHPLRQSSVSMGRDGVGQAGYAAIESIDDAPGAAAGDGVMPGAGDDLRANSSAGQSSGNDGPALTADVAAIIPALSRTAEMPVAFDQLAVSVGVCAVQPAEFPGGDMPLLAVCQAINDLVAQGARPMAITAGVTVVAGTKAADIDAILSGLVRSATRARVQLLAADLNAAASVSLNTTSTGWPRCRKSSGVVSITVTAFGQRGMMRPATGRVEAGDVLICPGRLGHHGLAVRMARCLPHLPSALRSDVAPLNDCLTLLESFAGEISYMRPCAAGGVSGAAHHLAMASDKCVILEESALDVDPEAQKVADMLGADPLEAANAGKLLIVARAAAAEQIITTLANHPLCRDLRIIGHVTPDLGGKCHLHTRLGGWREIHRPASDAALGAD